MVAAVTAAGATRADRGSKAPTLAPTWTVAAMEAAAAAVVAGTQR